MRLRQYKVWVKGSRISTESIVLARGIDNAKIKYASQLGKKSYEIEAVWTRCEVPTLGYNATR